MHLLPCRRPSLFLGPLAAALFVLVPMTVNSSTSDGGQGAPTPGPVSLVVRADAVRFTVRLSTHQELPDHQLYEIGEARKHLLEAVAHDGKLTVSLNTPNPDFNAYSAFNFSSGREAVARKLPWTCSTRSRTVST